MFITNTDELLPLKINRHFLFFFSQVLMFRLFLRVFSLKVSIKRLIIGPIIIDKIEFSIIVFTIIFTIK